MTRITIVLLAAVAAATLTALPQLRDSPWITLPAGLGVLIAAAAWYWRLDARQHPEAMPKLRVAGLAVLALVMAMVYALLVGALSLPEGLSILLLTGVLAAAAAAAVVALAAAIDLAMLSRLRSSRILAVLVAAGSGVVLTATVAGADVAAVDAAVGWARGPAGVLPLLGATALLALVAPMEWVVAMDRRQRLTVLLGWGIAVLPLTAAIWTQSLLPLLHQRVLAVAVQTAAALTLTFVVVSLARATLALPGARAYERKVRELETVYDFGLTAGFAFDPPKLRESALASVLRVAEPDVALLVEPDPDSAGCLCVLSRNDSAGRQVYRYGSRSRWTALATRFADRSPVVVVDHRKAPPGVLQRIWEPTMGSSVIVPVVGTGGTASAVLIVGRFQRYAFNAAEVRSLAGFATQVALAMDHARLLRDTVEAERRKRELEIARELQLNLLPKEAPTIAGLDIADRSDPATEIGGDYFDYLPLGEGRLGVVVGDVAGHGMAAGLLMAMAKSAIHTQVQVGSLPTELMGRLSETLLKMSADNQFMTLVFAELDVPCGRYRYSNAGHHYPLQICRSGEVRELESTGIPLGLLPRPPGPFRSGTMAVGDTFVFYSDGIVEASRPGDEEMFGTARLVDVVLAHRDRPANTIVDAIYKAVERHRGSATQDDDATVVIIRVVPT